MSQIEMFDDLFEQDEMSLDQYQGEATQYAFYDFSDVIYPAMGLASEAGEVMGKIKKLVRDDGIDFYSDNVAEQIGYEQSKAIASEIGDCLWYLANLASDLGYGLEEVAEMNLAKLKSRRRRGALRGSGDYR